MGNERGAHIRYRRLGTLILVAIFLGGLAACGPTTQSTKPDETSDSEQGYGGYGY